MVWDVRCDFSCLGGCWLSAGCRRGSLAFTFSVQILLLLSRVTLLLQVCVALVPFALYHLLNNLSFEGFDCDIFCLGNVDSHWLFRVALVFVF